MRGLLLFLGTLIDWVGKETLKIDQGRVRKVAPMGRPIDHTGAQLEAFRQSTGFQKWYERGTRPISSFGFFQRYIVVC
jgi:hypothetical protein